MKPRKHGPIMMTNVTTIGEMIGRMVYYFVVVVAILLVEIVVTMVVMVIAVVLLASVHGTDSKHH